MKSAPKTRGRWLAILRGAVLFSLAAIGFRTIPVVPEALFREDVRFTQKDPFTWQADISGLAPGAYYASMGHCSPPCDLGIDELVVDTTRSQGFPFKTKVFLGAAIDVGAANRPALLTLHCQQRYAGDQGYTTPTDRYVVASYRAGLMIQLLRIALYVVIGPAIALLLVASFLLQALVAYRRREAGPMERRGVTGDLRANWPVLYFAFSGLVHAMVSVEAHYFFFSGWVVPVIYALSRNNFTLSVVVLAGHHSRHRYWLWWGTLLSVAGSVYLGTISEAAMRPLFDLQMYWYVLITGIAMWDIDQVEARTRAVKLMQYMVTGWFLLQLPVLIRVATGVVLLPVSVVPGVIAVMTVVLAYLRYQETARQEQLERATTKALAALEGAGDPREVLKQVASVVSAETHFRRVSAYLDEYCLGAADEPGAGFVRVMEGGYREDKSRYKRIAFEAGQGSRMKEALSSGSARLERGAKDGAWFTVVPLGRRACVNLSDEQPEPEDRAYESLEVVTRLQPALRVLDERLADLAAKQGHALEKLRLRYGNGRWECEAGAVFADINDYSLHTEHFGGSFADFVSTVYAPALVLAVSRWAVPEFVRGDELYLVSLKEFVPQGLPVAEAALAAAAEVSAFCCREGAKLCADHGFPALTMSVGADAGKAWLVCDPIKVRTAGQSINDAKRLQEAAGPGGILIGAGLRAGGGPVRLGETEYVVGEPHPVLVKMNLIMARRLSPVPVG
ncbi:MAG: hypothetical protein HY927_08100 [Elusimicrobia bacterium]|nr:hypothetical protein [Elusimicrobiota bacterium]